MPHITARTKRRRSSTETLATRLRGRTGARGEQGVPGAAGVLSPEQLEYFERVTEEIALIHKDLDIQLRRFSQVQMQMDQLQAILVPTGRATRIGTVGTRKQAN